MRLIDADALMQALGITNMDCEKCVWFDWEWSNCKRGGDFEDTCCAIENAPTIEERKKGKWNYHEPLDVFECSVCGGQMVRNVFNYCPWCGADMRGDEDGRFETVSILQTDTSG